MDALRRRSEPTAAPSVVTNIYTLHPGDSRTLDAIAKASNRGNSAQGHRGRVRERVHA